MYADWYEKISRPFRSARVTTTLDLLDKGLVYALALAYFAFLGWLAFTGDMRLARAIAVPAATFVTVSIVRAFIDAPRPYEVCAIDPLIHKDTKGKSLPSRHVASAAIIACAILWINVPCGIVAWIACACVSFTRIVGGVHFPRDVAAALTLALACALIGFVLIP